MVPRSRGAVPPTLILVLPVYLWNLLRKELRIQDAFSNAGTSYVSTLRAISMRQSRKPTRSSFSPRSSGSLHISFFELTVLTVDTRLYKHRQQQQIKSCRVRGFGGYSSPNFGTRSLSPDVFLVRYATVKLRVTNAVRINGTMSTLVWSMQSVKSDVSYFKAGPIFECVPVQ